MNIYLDIDGVLLDKHGQPAEHLFEFLDYCTSNHTVYWLTTHCKGDATYTVQYLKNKMPDNVMPLLEKIKPTNWQTWKTDAIDFTKDFRWFDDYPMEVGKRVLKAHNSMSKLVLVDLKQMPDRLKIQTLNFNDLGVDTWTPLNLTLKFTLEEFELLKRGFDKGRDMDYKWHIYLEDDGWLYFDRSWSDWCAYKLRIERKNNLYHVQEVYTAHDDCGTTDYEQRLVWNNYHVGVLTGILFSHVFEEDWEIVGRHAQIGSCAIDIGGLHGINHWRNVEKIGLFLSQITGADEQVVRLFAYYHDAKRINEHHDPDHGARAAELFKQTAKQEGVYSDLTDKQRQQLIDALTNHSRDDAQSDDATIQTCWDADRLDLWRMNMVPDRALLFTDVAKTDEAFDYSQSLQGQ